MALHGLRSPAQELCTGQGEPGAQAWVPSWGSQGALWGDARWWVAAQATGAKTRTQVSSEPLLSPLDPAAFEGEVAEERAAKEPKKVLRERAGEGETISHNAAAELLSLLKVFQWSDFTMVLSTHMGRCAGIFVIAFICDVAGLIILLLGIFANLDYWDFFIYSGALLLAFSLVFWIFWYSFNIEVPFKELGF
ncbi:Transmembrane protein 238 [Platysternon megacephalum]|uniref:Transmembrane protein 238 n=1 Tax=Platysternon megacephalum TaxID=55544 RepID=A0A4D9E2P9_9SAUR|nr:Transmembrane protein 238 [Platysternon megacephalum]